MWLAMLVVLTTVVSQMASAAGRHKCQGLVKYNVTFHALWSKENFPKQYPNFRPHAQWTKMIGKYSGLYLRGPTIYIAYIGLVYSKTIYKQWCSAKIRGLKSVGAYLDNLVPGSDSSPIPTPEPYRCTLNN